MSFSANLSPEFVENQYRLWRESPGRVPFEWRVFFEGFDIGRWVPGTTLPGEARLTPELALKHSAVQSLIYRYRSMGHLLACTDPLSPCPIRHPLLDPGAFELSEADLETLFHTRRFLKPSATLGEIIEVMRDTYCRSIGVEFMHIEDPLERQWLIDRMEPVRNRPDFSLNEKIRIHYMLLSAGLFEGFLHKKFLGQKRFSLEGGEVVIPMLDGLVNYAASLEIDDIILGMSHRGRLNVMSNVFRKPYANVFAEFEDNLEFGFVGEGDVKYHKGFSTDLETPCGRRIHLSLASNPSHLEAVDPVVEGKCRARQDSIGPRGEKRVLPVLMHGDAAFSGQGILAETLNLSQLEGYCTGGTFHLVINNQIGFTTPPAEGRSTRYATDVAKMLSVPIFHIHGEDPEAAVYAARLALDYRQQFGKDVVLEVICFRRLGHNEADEPFFTQPLMYEKISKRPPIHEIHAERLREEGLGKEQLQAMASDVAKCLDMSHGGEPIEEERGFFGKWSGIEREFSTAEVKTGVEKGTLTELARLLTAVPDSFTPHPKIAKLLERRRQTVEKGEELDWGSAEALAFASLLHEGIAIRLSGQDSQRGTFNHRHGVLFDVKTGESYTPLANTATHGAALRIFNSMLSEAAVLGFEYGYSLETPLGLTIWEAQFGDFANGAQVIIDQFVASSGAKWDRLCGLVLLLPHGFEGQGAEHSSARIERYLQLCAHNNLLVVNPSTPAQFFHLLRRQVKQSFRRPLVVFTPKSLLRHPLCRSPLEDLQSGGFREILPAAADEKKVRSVLICTGKIYFELQEKIEEAERDDVALIRVEQLYPLRTELLEEALTPFSRAERFAWVQEEPRNNGAWFFLQPVLADILGRPVEYVGRDEAASPAVGSHRLHNREQEQLLKEALT